MMMMMPTGRHVVAAYPCERRVSVARLRLLLLLLGDGLEVAVVAAGVRVVRRTVQVVHAQHLDFLLLETLLLVARCLRKVSTLLFFYIYIYRRGRSGILCKRCFIIGAIADISPLSRLFWKS